ncbi:transporter substrate-binding domain-containing protein [Halomonas sabkhae]|uniref:substrate-binding periplasmic protein n=1 Tax=Halomonas sabkhae TaxID=626223 RepID=UPI0025B2EEC2|nr:transporter substrate-binding domain-containing protein [Halomonas sabkhae]MDN3525916.1 transporter substrate-binding domain-containing protein [Halomonas sabkhae]
MRCTRAILVLLASLMLCSAGGAHADRIVIASDEWCPYNCAPGSDKPGYVVELARHIFEKAGHEVVYKTLPWQRALQAGVDGDVTAVISVSEEPEGRQMIKPREPMGFYQVAFYTRADSDWQYDGVASLEGKAIGVIGGYSYFLALDAYIARRPDRISTNRGPTALERNLKMVANGRLEVTMDNSAVANYTIVQSGLQDKLRLAGKNPTATTLHLAFTKEQPNTAHYARLWTQGIRRLRESGELATFLGRYNVADWHRE